MPFGQFLLCKNYLTGVKKIIFASLINVSKQKSPKKSELCLILTRFLKNNKKKGTFLFPETAMACVKLSKYS